MYDPLHIAPLGQEKTRGYVIYFFFIFYNHYAPDGAFLGNGFKPFLSHSERSEMFIEKKNKHRMHPP